MGKRMNPQVNVPTRIPPTAIVLLLLAGWFPVVYVFNLPLFHTINGDYGPVLNMTSLWTTQFGDGFTAATLLVVLWLANRSRSLAGIFALILVPLVTQPLKDLFNEPRPAKVLDDLTILGETLRYRSFPSGHSATIAAVLRPLWDWKGPWGNAVLLVVMVGVAGSRVLVGAHFPADVIAGMFFGWICGEIGVFIVRQWRAKPLLADPAHAPGTDIAAVILLIGGSVYSVVWFDVGYDGGFYVVFGLLVLGLTGGLAWRKRRRRS
jgi:undecaprenyl-diphosphatase